MAQNFKGDEKELKIQAVMDTLLDLTDAALDDFYSQGFNASPFLLEMYDSKRMPFSERVTRDSFVEFIKQVLTNFPFTGTFEVYLSILTAIFGVDSEIRFTVPTPGKLAIDVEAVANSTFDLIGREFVSGSYVYFDMIDSDGDTFLLRGVSGIDTEYQLSLLFSEIMPAGIVPAITLGFYDISDFAYDDTVGDEIETDDGYGIIFVEGGA
jgi:hypothetical protein